MDKSCLGLQHYLEEQISYDIFWLIFCKLRTIYQFYKLIQGISSWKNVS